MGFLDYLFFGALLNNFKNRLSNNTTRSYQQNTYANKNYDTYQDNLYDNEDPYDDFLLTDEELEEEEQELYDYDKLDDDDFYEDEEDMDFYEDEENWEDELED